MDESMFGWDLGLGGPIDSAEPLEIEFGSLVAALSARTEDETELELQLRALVECGRFRVGIGIGTGTGSDRADAMREN